MMEVDAYLEHSKLDRALSYLSAIVYTFVFVYAFLWLLDYIDDWGDRQIGIDELFVAMTISYNMIIHIGILPINIAIIAKEISMKYFQFLNYKAGTNSDKIELNEGDVIDEWNEDVKYVEDEYSYVRREI